MSVTETRWVLKKIKENWPGGYPATELWRIDENEPEILDGPRTGERSKSVDTSNAAIIRASGAGQPRSPVGTEFRYTVDTLVDVTVEAVHETEYGTVASSAEFSKISLATRAAVQKARQYPEPDFPADHPQPPDYHTAVIEDVTDSLSTPNESSYYRQDFTVRLKGLEPTVEES